MGTGLVTDHKLMRQAMKASGLASKNAVIEEGLRLLVKVHQHRSIRCLRGKIAMHDDVLKKE